MHSSHRMQSDAFRMLLSGLNSSRRLSTISDANNEASKLAGQLRSTDADDSAQVTHSWILFQNRRFYAGLQERSKLWHCNP